MLAAVVLIILIRASLCEASAAAAGGF